MKYILHTHNTHLQIDTDIQNSWTQNILYLYESFIQYSFYAQCGSREDEDEGP